MSRLVQRGFWVAVLVSLLVAVPANAQNDTPCPPTATIEQCFVGFLEGRRADSLAKVREQTAQATTGPQVTLPEAKAAIRDFLPRVAAALIAPGVEEEREALALRFNQALGPATAQVGVELHSPVLFGPLADTVSTDVRTALEEGLEDEDDVAFSLAINWESRTIGRRFGPHRDEISDVVRELLPGPDNATDAALEAIEALVPSLPSGMAPGQAAANPSCRDANMANRPLSCFRQTFADSLRLALREGAAGLAALRAQRRAALENVGLIAISQLLGNQPQLNFTFGYRARADVVGPDEWTGTVRYERGGRDLNWLRRTCGGTLTADCLASQLTSRSTREAIGRAERFVAELQVAHRPEHDINLADPALSLLNAASTEIRGSVIYGRYFGELADGTRRPRMDASVSFQYQADGSARNDRLLGEITYTLPLSGNLAGVFGVAFANKPEFISEDARRLFATLGLTC